VNSALRLLMRPSAPSFPPVAPLRFKQGEASPGNVTVTFTEPTPLDNTHLLVAIAYQADAGATVPSASGAWTRVADYPSVSGARITLFVCRGDGATNAITVSAASTFKRLTLLAFSGYSSLTPLLQTHATGGSATSKTITPGSSPAGYGVAIACLCTSNSSGGFGSWSDGFTIVGTTGSWSRDSTAYKTYGNGVLPTTLTWTTARTSNTLLVVMPLV
jgi:hypothetical protein